MESPEHIRQRAELYKGLWQLVATYWILVVVGAFLLVTMTGDPSFFKLVYLLFFFYFMITYQVRVGILDWRQCLLQLHMQLSHL